MVWSVASRLLTSSLLRPAGQSGCWLSPRRGCTSVNSYPFGLHTPTATPPLPPLPPPPPHPTPGLECPPLLGTRTPALFTGVLGTKMPQWGSRTQA